MAEEKVYGIIVRTTIADMIYVRAESEEAARQIAADLVLEGAGVVDLDFHANYDSFDTEVDETYTGEELDGLENKVGRIFSKEDTIYAE